MKIAIKKLVQVKLVNTYITISKFQFSLMAFNLSVLSLVNKNEFPMKKNDKRFGVNEVSYQYLHHKPASGDTEGCLSSWPFISDQK